MKIFLLTTLCLSLSLMATAQTLPGMPYHPSPKRPVVDTYFGKAVTDNYRWLEDMNSSETKDWFKAQGDYSNRMLAQIPGRDALIKTFQEYDALKSVTIGEVLARGGHYFYRKALPGEKVGKVYYRASKTAPEKLLFDPVDYDKTKTYAVTGFTPSEDGQQIAIGLAEGGVEISTIRVMNIATKLFLPESITGVSGGAVVWTPDNKGFLYTPQNSLDPKDLNVKLDTRARYHRLGTDHTDTELLSRSRYPDLGIRPDQIPVVRYDEQYTHLFGGLYSVDRRQSVFIAPVDALNQPVINWQRLIMPEDSIYSYDVLDEKLYLLSVKGASNGPINTPEFGTLKDLVECMALYEMDALYHVQDGVKYPAVIGVGGWNDPRVIVWQPGKFAAALQNATSSGKPVLMQVNYDNGHFTEDKAVTFRNFANMYAFVLWQAGHPDFQPTGSFPAKVAEKK